MEFRKGQVFADADHQGRCVATATRIAFEILRRMAIRVARFGMDPYFHPLKRHKESLACAITQQVRDFRIEIAGDGESLCGIPPSDLLRWIDVL